jgi:hypothetical protein
MMARASEGPHLMAGHVDEDDFGLKLVRVDVGTGCDQRDRRAVGRETRVGEAHGAQDIADTHRYRSSDDGREYEQRKSDQCGRARGHEVSSWIARSPQL